VLRGTHLVFSKVAKPEELTNYPSLTRQIKGMWTNGVEPELVAGVQGIEASLPDPGGALTALGRMELPYIASPITYRDGLCLSNIAIRTNPNETGWIGNSA